MSFFWQFFTPNPKCGVVDRNFSNQNFSPKSFWCYSWVCEDHFKFLERVHRTHNYCHKRVQNFFEEKCRKYLPEVGFKFPVSKRKIG